MSDNTGGVRDGFESSRVVKDLNIKFRAENEEQSVRKGSEI